MSARFRLPRRLAAYPPWQRAGLVEFFWIERRAPEPMLTILVQSVIPRNRLGVGTSTIQFLRLIGSTIGTAVVGAAVSAIYAARLAAAIPAGADTRLLETFESPQALIDPRAQERVSQLAEQLGPDGAALLQQLADAAGSALIAGVRLGYILGVVGAAVVLVLVIMLPVPDYQAVASKIVRGNGNATTQRRKEHM